MCVCSPGCRRQPTRPPIHDPNPCTIQHNPCSVAHPTHWPMYCILHMTCNTVPHQHRHLPHVALGASPGAFTKRCTLPLTHSPRPSFVVVGVVLWRRRFSLSSSSSPSSPSSSSSSSSPVACRRHGRLSSWSSPSSSVILRRHHRGRRRRRRRCRCN
jgi:hypothetical protein